MYDDDLLAAPRDQDHFWELIETHFEHIEYLLTQVPFESKEAALDRAGRGHAPGRRRPSMERISYRHISAGYDQREHFFDMGQTLLSVVAGLIEKRELSPLFVQEWGKLMFCHGYAASHFFDDSDDQHKRQQGQKGGLSNAKPAQRQWFAKTFMHLKSQGLKPKDIHDALERHIQAIVRRNDNVAGFPASWFDRLLVDGQVATTHHYSQFTPANMRKILSKNHGPIPPIPDVLLS